MIIDGHTHMLHSSYFNQLADEGGKWTKQRIEWAMALAKRRPYITDIPLRLDQLDRNGIDLQVTTAQWTFDSNLLPADVNTQLAYARVLNNSMAQLTEDSKGRFISIGTVPLANFENGGRQEMERAIKELGLKAIAVSSNINGKPIDLPEFESFWAQASEMDVAVYIHPADAADGSIRSYEAGYDLMQNYGWPFETQLILTRLVFSGIMERYPTLKVVGHHLGGGIPFLLGRTLEHFNPFLYPELNGLSDQEKHIGQVLPKPLFDYFARFYYDTACCAYAPAIKCTCEAFGVDQVIFSTDAPFGPGSGEWRMVVYPKVIESLGFSREDVDKIFANNIRKVLNLE
ncbi:amidohydrolase family protein [Chloroflexota bacterium]